MDVCFLLCAFRIPEKVRYRQIILTYRLALVLSICHSYITICIADVQFGSPDGAARLFTTITPRRNAPPRKRAWGPSIADIATSCSKPSPALKLPPPPTSKHMSFLLRTPFKTLLTTRTFATASRAMAPKQEWMVILPDYAGKLAERNKVRT